LLDRVIYAGVLIGAIMVIGPTQHFGQSNPVVQARIGVNHTSLSDHDFSQNRFTGASFAFDIGGQWNGQKWRHELNGAMANQGLTTIGSIIGNGVQFNTMDHRFVQFRYEISRYISRGWADIRLGAGLSSMASLRSVTYLYNRTQTSNDLAGGLILIAGIRKKFRKVSTELQLGMVPMAYSSHPAYGLSQQTYEMLFLNRISWQEGKFCIAVPIGKHWFWSSSYILSLYHIDYGHVFNIGSEQWFMGLAYTL